MHCVPLAWVSTLQLPSLPLHHVGMPQFQSPGWPAASYGQLLWSKVSSSKQASRRQAHPDIPLLCPGFPSHHHTRSAMHLSFHQHRMVAVDHHLSGTPSARARSGLPGHLGNRTFSALTSRWMIRRLCRWIKAERTPNRTSVAVCLGDLARSWESREA